MLNMNRRGFYIFSLSPVPPPVFSIIHFTYQISNLDKYQSLFSYAVNLSNALISVYVTKKVTSCFQEQMRKTVIFRP